MPLLSVPVSDENMLFLPFVIKKLNKIYGAYNRLNTINPFIIVFELSPANQVCNETCGYQSNKSFATKLCHESTNVTQYINSE